MVKGESGDTSIPVFGLLSKIKVQGAKVTGRFRSGQPAVTERKVGKGVALYCGFLPGLSYFQPAMPLRPMDRGSRDDAMTHFLPTEFHKDTAKLIRDSLGPLEPPVVCSDNLVESTVLQAKSGTVIPLINWTSHPVKGLQVSVRIPIPTGKVSLASGQPVRMEKQPGGVVFTLDLDVADALILR